MLVDEYGKRLFYTIYRFTHNYDDTEDIIQEVWIKFYNNVWKFRQESSIYTFLYRIAVNTSINCINRKKRMQEIIKMIPFIQNRDNPAEEAIRNEEMMMLKKGIDKLPKQQQAAFILHREENLSFKQIGEILEKSENNVKVSYHYAIKKLKNHLKKEGVL